MKKWLIVLSSVLSLALVSCKTEIVATRPADVVYTRPVSPGPGFIWIGGDWAWTGGEYRWTEGHWEKPRPGKVWHNGGWTRKHNGYRWKKGHW